MKFGIIVVFVLLAFSACASEHHLLSVHDLLLSTEEVALLQLSVDQECVIEEYQTSETSPLAQSSFCSFVSQNDSVHLIIDIKKYTNEQDVLGSFQYQSSRHRSPQGILAQNTHGSYSTFVMNVEEDYMGHLNDPEMYYYHLWIAKDLFLIHITSRGTVSDESLLLAVADKLLLRFA